MKYLYLLFIGLTKGDACLFALSRGAFWCFRTRCSHIILFFSAAGLIWRTHVQPLLWEFVSTPTLFCSLGQLSIRRSLAIMVQKFLQENAKNYVKTKNGTHEEIISFNF